MDWRQLSTLHLSIACAMLVAGMLLLIGYMTPITGVAAGVISLGSIFSWLPGSRLDLFYAKPTAGFATVIALALVCLGPGAFSLDAHMFGRREIIIPNGSTSNES
jgi:uncharacterized membrane protein YphA (DoxX/SURF4 family)